MKGNILLSSSHGGLYCLCLPEEKISIDLKVYVLYTQSPKMESISIFQVFIVNHIKSCLDNFSNTIHFFKKEKSSWYISLTYEMAYQSSVIFSLWLLWSCTSSESCSPISFYQITIIFFLVVKQYEICKCVYERE